MQKKANICIILRSHITVRISNCWFLQVEHTFSYIPTEEMQSAVIINFILAGAKYKCYILIKT